MTKPNLKTQVAKGFSLVEMLVVIAVIGILAAIAVPQIGRINDAAEESKDRRNAQNIASVCGAAQAAGHSFIAASEALTVDAVVTGTTISDTSSAFNGTFFGVPNLTANEKTGALQYLSLQNGMLVYTGYN